MWKQVRYTLENVGLAEECKMNLKWLMNNLFVPKSNDGYTA